MINADDSIKADLTPQQIDEKIEEWREAAQRHADAGDPERARGCLLQIPKLEAQKSEFLAKQAAKEARRKQIMEEGRIASEERARQEQLERESNGDNSQKSEALPDGLIEEPFIPFDGIAGLYSIKNAQGHIKGYCVYWSNSEKPALYIEPGISHQIKGSLAMDHYNKIVRAKKTGQGNFSGRVED